MDEFECPSNGFLVPQKKFPYMFLSSLSSDISKFIGSGEIKTKTIHFQNIRLTFNKHLCFHVKSGQIEYSCINANLMIT